MWCGSGDGVAVAQVANMSTAGIREIRLGRSADGICYCPLLIMSDNTGTGITCNTNLEQVRTMPARQAAVLQYPAV